MLRWLFQTENPVRLWGFWPCLPWFIISALFLVFFIGFEVMGLMRYHGMVPYTYLLRCLPRAFWIVGAGLAIWHFDLIRTVARAVSLN
jgi:hypothetical protein